MRRLLAGATLIVAALQAACGARKDASDASQPRHEIRMSSAPEDGRSTVRVEMRNVDFHVDESVVLQIRRLSGALVPTRAGSFPVFDDKTSFVLKISRGEIAIDAGGLSDLMNRYAFASPDAPMKKISVEIDGGEIHLKAKLRKTGLPIEIAGKLEAEPEGAIRLRPTSVRLAHLPVRGLLALLKLKLGKLVDLSRIRGVAASGNDLLLRADQILPPPRIEGRMSSVRIGGNRVVQLFGADGPGRDRESDHNFMYYRGGTLRFGKLTMHDADLEIIDQSPKDPFDFYLDRYRDQLVAGYSKTTPSFGLKVFMPDFHRLKGFGSSVVPRPGNAS